MFECIRCGLCCRNVDLVDELSEFDRGDGICKYLNLINNLCTIYDSRPRVCNVKKSYEDIYYKIYSKEEFYRLNYEGCKLLWKKKRIKKRE